MEGTILNAKQDSEAYSWLLSIIILFLRENAYMHHMRINQKGDRENEGEKKRERRERKRERKKERRKGQKIN